jgi:hypothetical protein
MIILQIINTKNPCFSINLTHEQIGINPVITVINIPYISSVEKIEKSYLTISRVREPNILGTASNIEKEIALRRSIASILAAVIVIPKRLTPGKIETA